MAVEVVMPQMGESVVEGTITKWLVKPGDVVAEDQPLVEISTDKVDTEIPSPSAGTIAKLVAEEGQTLPVGAVIALIDAQAKSSGAGAQPAKPAAPQAPPARAQPAPPQAVRVAPAPAAAEPTRAPAAPAMAPGAEAAADAPRAASPPEVRLPRTDEHRRYSPVVVRIAAEHGLDIERIPGTGIGGRVSKRDVEKYLASLQQGGGATDAAIDADVVILRVLAGERTFGALLARHLELLGR